ncbi:MAG: helix-turn-helix transcriptional regulator [Coleofasciculus sp. C1-SOL-03]
MTYPIILTEAISVHRMSQDSNLPTLRQVRERLNMTQEEFARELGTITRTIGRHERGEHKLRLTLGQIKRLKELLEQAGMSIDDLPDDID